MNSPHQREQLPDLLSDALDATERARVESHLAQCAQCARELRALELMQQTLVTLPSVAPPGRVRANVRAALRANKKQVWTLPAFLAARQRAKKVNQQSAALTSSSKPPQRIGSPKALPFALPARQLAWGGAVAVGAIGLMLLARPALQNGSLSQTAPVGEAELAARAATEQNSAQMDDAFAGSAGPAANGATANSAPGVNNTATGVNNDSPTTNSGKVPTTSEKPQTKSKATGAPKFAPGSVLPPQSSAELPPLPPPPSRTRTTRPENFAPAPRNNAPSFDFLPAPPPRSPRNSRPSAPAAIAPAPEAKSEPPAKSAPPVQSKLSPAAPPKIQNPPTKATRPAPRSADAEARTDARNENDFAPAPMNEAPRDGASDGARVGRRGDSDASTPASSAPPVTSRALEAPAQKSAANPSPNWMGGDVTATFSKETAENQPPVLILGVAKAIGNARLILRLPSGETQVWRGSMNAVPLEIKLPNLPDNLRSGQRIHARLEQTDGVGNPKGSTTFTLLWP